VTLHAVTLSGLAGYASNPLQQSLPGANGTPTAVTDTHTDYYVVHGGYEYHLTTDAVSGEGTDANLQSMMASFTITG
jgi:hypothetical protein